MSGGFEFRWYQMNGDVPSGDALRTLHSTPVSSPAYSENRNKEDVRPARHANDPASFSPTSHCSNFINDEIMRSAWDTKSVQWWYSGPRSGLESRGRMIYHPGQGQSLERPRFGIWRFISKYHNIGLQNWELLYNLRVACFWKRNPPMNLRVIRIPYSGHGRGMIGWSVWAYVNISDSDKIYRLLEHMCQSVY